MSFIGEISKGTTYNPGHFLAYNDENVTRETREMSPNSAFAVTAPGGGKYVPMGTPYPTNDSSVAGITYEDVDVTTGTMPASVVTGGAVVYENRLPVTIAGGAKSVLESAGFKFIAEEPAVTRPY